MKFMRRVPHALSKFVYPRVADVDVVNDEQVLMKLPPPSFRRGTFEFGLTLCGMNVQ